MNNLDGNKSQPEVRTIILWPDAAICAGAVCYFVGKVLSWW